MEQARQFLGGLIDLAFPPLCAGCGEFCEAPSALCDNCLKRIDRYEFPLCLTCEQPVVDGTSCPECGKDSFVLFAFGNYVDPLKQAVIQFKFRNVTRLASIFADELSSKFGDKIVTTAPNWLVPIPLHPSREHARGYNQAAILAQALGEKLNLPTNLDLIQRVKAAKPQARLSKSARAANIKGVFAAVAQAEAGETVILVDDVVTGGHTVREARSVLLGAGFKVPAVISIAHGL